MLDGFGWGVVWGVVWGCSGFGFDFDFGVGVRDFDVILTGDIESSLMGLLCPTRYCCIDPIVLPQSFGGIGFDLVFTCLINLFICCFRDPGISDCSFNFA